MRELESKLRALTRRFRGTSARTFFLYPAITILTSLLFTRRLRLSIWGFPLMLWGYMQYRLVGSYLMEQGQGSGYGQFSWSLSPREGPQGNRAPSQLVTSGPYSVSRNPMYMGHVIFMAGLALAVRSPVSVALAVYHTLWLQERALEDEKQLSARFGEEYTAYQQRVERWLPIESVLGNKQD
jgi:hypothetical protein